MRATPAVEVGMKEGMIWVRVGTGTTTREALDAANWMQLKEAVTVKEEEVMVCGGTSHSTAVELTKTAGTETGPKRQQVAEDGTKFNPRTNSGSEPLTSTTAGETANTVGGDTTCRVLVCVDGESLEKAKANVYEPVTFGS